MDNDSTRDRVRALVREVLAKAAPESVPDEPPSRFVNTVPDKPAAPAFTRDESAKSVITEDDVRGLEPGAVLRIGEDARLTPLAADVINERKIAIVRRTSRRGSKASKLVAVGADHGGFKMKEDLKSLLNDLGHKVQDFGTDSEDAVDYPDFARAVAEGVAAGKFDRGILICGTGVGMAIAANKIAGVRSAAIVDTDTAKLSREHNDLNVIALGARVLPESRAREIVKTFLETRFEGGRHAARVQKIEGSRVQ